jgi:hypothetical protein
LRANHNLRSDKEGLKMSISQRRHISIPAPLFNIGDTVTWRVRHRILTGKIESLIYCQEEDCCYWQYQTLIIGGVMDGQWESVFEKEITDYWNETWNRG